MPFHRATLSCRWRRMPSAVITLTATKEMPAVRRAELDVILLRRERGETDGDVESLRLSLHRRTFFFGVVSGGGEDGEGLARAGRGRRRDDV